MRTVPGPTDHVVVVGAGLSGLACALHLLGAGRQVTVVERDVGPGGRAGRVRLGDYKVDTGPTVLTMPHLADEAFAAVGDSLYRHVELTALHPAYRACFADGDLTRRAHRRRGHGGGGRRFAGPAEARGYLRTAGLAGAAVPGADAAASSTPTSTHPSSCSPPDLARLGGPGRLRPAGPAHRPLPGRRSPAPGLLLPGPVRRSHPGQGPRRVRGDRLHGHRRRRVLPAAAACTRFLSAMAKAAADAGAEFR